MVHFPLMGATAVRTQEGGGPGPPGSPQTSGDGSGEGPLVPELVPSGPCRVPGGWAPSRRKDSTNVLTVCAKFS